MEFLFRYYSSFLILHHLLHIHINKHQLLLFTLLSLLYYLMHERRKEEKKRREYVYVIRLVAMNRKVAAKKIFSYVALRGLLPVRIYICIDICLYVCCSRIALILLLPSSLNGTNGIDNSLSICVLLLLLRDHLCLLFFCLYVY
jgi:hypothetical protein